ISFWQSKEAMLASEPTAQQLRDQDVETRLAAQAPIVERYTKSLSERSSEVRPDAPRPRTINRP
ncbi:MAG: hypothetical protein M3P18_05525, partial [Actinomycetota bacterium]|nr:hypothetical protein [Actinomycetota bacterium]